MKSSDWRSKKNKAKFFSLFLFTHLCKVPHFSLLAAFFIGEGQGCAEELQQLWRTFWNEPHHYPFFGVTVLHWFSTCEKGACCCKGTVLDMVSGVLKMYLSNFSFFMPNNGVLVDWKKHQWVSAGGKRPAYHPEAFWEVLWRQSDAFFSRSHWTHYLTEIANSSLLLHGFCFLNTKIRMNTASLKKIQLPSPLKIYVQNTQS